LHQVNNSMDSNISTTTGNQNFFHVAKKLKITQADMGFFYLV
jgi:hypothetical protein